MTELVFAVFFCITCAVFLVYVFSKSGKSDLNKFIDKIDKKDYNDLLASLRDKAVQLENSEKTVRELRDVIDKLYKEKDELRTSVLELEKTVEALQESLRYRVNFIEDTVATLQSIIKSSGVVFDVEEVEEDKETTEDTQRS